jgi:hypothetical protein
MIAAAGASNGIKQLSDRDLAAINELPRSAAINEPPRPGRDQRINPRSADQPAIKGILIRPVR